MMLANGAADAGELRVLVSGAFTGAFKTIAPRFEKETGLTLSLSWGPSFGTTRDALPVRIAAGQPADVLLQVHIAQEEQKWGWEAAELEERQGETAKRRREEAQAATELQPLEAELRAAVTQHRLQEELQAEMRAQQARLEADMRAQQAQLEELAERLAQRRALAGLGAPPGLLPPGLQEMVGHGDVAQPCTPACVVGGGSSRGRPPHVFLLTCLKRESPSFASCQFAF